MSSHRRSCRGNVNGASSLSSLKCQLIISTYLKTPLLPRLNFFECLYSIRKGFRMFFFLFGYLVQWRWCLWVARQHHHLQSLDLIWGIKAVAEKNRRRERERENEKECCWSCRVRCLSLLYLAGAARKCEKCSNCSVQFEWPKQVATAAATSSRKLQVAVAPADNC